MEAISKETNDISDDGGNCRNPENADTNHQNESLTSSTSSSSEELFFTEEVRAHKELAAILVVDPKDNAMNVPRAMELLLAYPILAQRTYHVFDFNGDQVTPLCALLCSSCQSVEVQSDDTSSMIMRTSGSSDETSSTSQTFTLEQVQTVYDMYPEAVCQPQGLYCNSALFYACRFHGGLDVVEFVFHKNPAALLKPNKYGALLLDILIRDLRYLSQLPDRRYSRFQNVRLPVLKRLLQLQPDAVTTKTASGRNVLEEAVCMGCPLPVLQCIAELYPPELESFVLKSKYLVLGRTETELLCETILPQLRCFVCEPRIWNPLALEVLLQHLCACNNLQQLYLGSLPILGLSQSITSIGFVPSFHQQPGVLGMLEQLLANATSLKVVRLGAVESSTATEDATSNDADLSLALCSVLRGLSRNQSLEDAKLHGFYAPSPAVLERILNSPEDLATTSTDMATPPFSQSQIRKLKLCLWNMRVPEALPQLVAMFGSSLQELDFSFVFTRTQELDWTATIVQILHDGQLQRLTLGSGVRVDMEPICQALAQNTVMKQLTIYASLIGNKQRSHLIELLKHSNTTLEEVVVAFLEPRGYGRIHQDKQLKYYLNLNRYGRKVARDSETTKDIFVQLLEYVSEVNEGILATTEATNVRFGLLQEAPSLWTRQSRT